MEIVKQSLGAGPIDRVIAKALRTYRAEWEKAAFALEVAEKKLLAVEAILVQVRGENEIASTGLKPEHHALAYAWSCKVAEMIAAEWKRISDTTTTPKK